MEKDTITIKTVDGKIKKLKAFKIDILDSKAQEFCNEINKKRKTNATNYKVGDMVHWYAGYYNNIPYYGSINAIDDEGNIYLYSDSYWYGKEHTKIIGIVVGKQD